ncbi:hypothetical protein D3C76_56220 [compost metagenome]
MDSLGRKRICFSGSNCPWPIVLLCMLNWYYINRSISACDGETGKDGGQCCSTAWCVIPFLLGALVAPQVGIAGEYTAVPLGIIILVTSTAAMLAFFLMIRKHVAPQQAHPETNY